VVIIRRRFEPTYLIFVIVTLRHITSEIHLNNILNLFGRVQFKEQNKVEVASAGWIQKGRALGTKDAADSRVSVNRTEFQQLFIVTRSRRIIKNVDPVIVVFSFSVD